MEENYLGSLRIGMRPNWEGGKQSDDQPNYSNAFLFSSDLEDWIKGTRKYKKKSKES